jgi:ubiquinone/menaquinone biosynthesis C-methylase UbiE
MMNKRMESYYARRAAEYDRIYEKPERQSDLADLKTTLSTYFEGMDVLEIACGTGYWTQYIAKSASSILATDFNLEMLNIAAKRDYSSCPVSFKTIDAYKLDGIPAGFDGAFAGFFWSHVPFSGRASLIHTFHSHLAENARVVWIDGRYVEGSSTAIARRDSAGNTYQIRTLSDGSQHEVIKNYPSQTELLGEFGLYGSHVEVRLLKYFWLLSYNVKKIKGH